MNLPRIRALLLAAPLATQTGAALMRFGSGYGAFRRYLGQKRRLRMYVATLVGDGEGRTMTVKRAVTVTARAGLR